MPLYAVHIVGRMGCGCEASIDFDLPEDSEPTPGDVAAIMYSSLDPEISDLLEFLMRPTHSRHGSEKVTVTAQVKVR